MMSADTMEQQVSVLKQHKRRSQAAEVWHRMKKNRGAMLGLAIVILLAVVALGAGFFFDYETDVIGQDMSIRLQSPSAEHWMGTDQFGRDIYARLIYGSRYSLSVGIVAVAVGLLFGVVLGATAGYCGGIIENIIMRAADMLAAIPSILTAIVVVSVLGQSFFNLMLAVGITSIPQFIRITRAAVITVRDQEYIEASRAIGLRDPEIIAWHILPNCISPIIVQTTLRVATAIVTASSLSFLGLGIPQPSPEWGSMLSLGRRFIRDYSYMTFFPGLAIMITVLALNLLGDGLRDALDPKLKK